MSMQITREPLTGGGATAPKPAPAGQNVMQSPPPGSGPNDPNGGVPGPVDPTLPLPPHVEAAQARESQKALQPPPPGRSSPEPVGKAPSDESDDSSLPTAPPLPPPPPLPGTSKTPSAPHVNATPTPDAAGAPLQRREGEGPLPE